MKSTQKALGNILWIDDAYMDPFSIVRRKKLELEGYRVVPAATNDAALKLLETAGFNFDLIIQDIIRPLGSCLEGKGISESFSGIAFWESFIKNRFSDIPTIFHSARLDEIRIQEKIAALPNCFSVPIFDHSNLLIVVQSCLSEKERIYDSDVDNRRVQTLHIEIAQINQELIDFLSKNPKYIYNLSHRKFEELVADLLERQGFSVTLTPRTRDGGVDIFAFQELQIGPILAVVECKKYHPERKVGVEVVRSIHGVKDEKRANIGVVVTTSFFTKPALEFKKNVGLELSLQDYNVLKDWLIKFQQA